MYLFRPRLGVLGDESQSQNRLIIGSSSSGGGLLLNLLASFGEPADWLITRISLGGPLHHLDHGLGYVFGAAVAALVHL